MRSRSEPTPSSRRLRHWAGGIAVPSRSDDSSVAPTGGWVPDWDLLPETAPGRDAAHGTSDRRDRLVRRRRRGSRWVTPGFSRDRGEGFTPSWTGAQPADGDGWSGTDGRPETDDWSGGGVDTVGPPGAGARQGAGGRADRSRRRGARGTTRPSADDGWHGVGRPDVAGLQTSGRRPVATEWSEVGRWDPEGLSDVDGWPAADDPDPDDWLDAEDPDPDDGDETGAVPAGLERRTRGRGLVPPEERWRAVRERGDRWTERWLPAPWVSARRRISARAAVVVTVVAVVGVLVAGWTWWSARPAATPLSVTGPAQVGGVPASGTVSASAPGDATVVPTAAQVDPATAAPTVVTATAPVEIWVSVTGRVHDPGLVRLPVGARVADALAAAGGLVDEQDLVGINLAQVLVDGQSVVVAERGTSVSPISPGVPAKGAADTAADSEGPLDLNSTDQAALEGLPGVGPVTAEAILGWRAEHGPFTSVEQLREIPGIGPARFERLVAEVTVG